eukprot:gene7744-8585_t
MKGFLPSLRKWKSTTPTESISSSSKKKSKDIERIHGYSRSFDGDIGNVDSIDHGKGGNCSIDHKRRTYSGGARLHFESLSLSHPDFPSYFSSSVELLSPDDNGGIKSEPLKDYTFVNRKDRTKKRGILKYTSSQENISPGSSPGQTELSEMVDQDDIIALTRHVRSFSDSLNSLRDTFVLDNGCRNPNEVKAQAHQQLGSVLSILKGVLEGYPAISSNEVLMSAGIVIKKIKDHGYSSIGEPQGLFEATDQLALTFSSSVSDYLMGDQDMPQSLTVSQSDMRRSFENLKGNETGFDEDDDKQDYLEDGQEFLDYEYQSVRADSEESLDRVTYEGGKPAPLSVEAQANSTPIEGSRISNAESSAARMESLDKALLSIEGSVDIALQRTKVWSKYAKDIIGYMERRAHIEAEYCNKLAKLAQATKPNITEESYLPFQSTYATSLEDDLNYAASCQKKLQLDLRGNIVKMLTAQRNEHDRVRSKVKEKWTKECKKLNDSVYNLKKAKSVYIQKQQELEKGDERKILMTKGTKKFVDKQDGKEEVNANSSSVVHSFYIGKKKKEEDIAKRAEEAEDYYRKCVDDANSRQNEVEKTRESILLELRDLIYQCDLTMKEITCRYFQLVKSLSAPLRVQYQTLAEDSRQYIVGTQFAEFIKIQKATSKAATPKLFTFELYVASDKTDGHKGYIGPADVQSPSQQHQSDDYSPSGRRRISTISAGSDSSLNRTGSPTNGSKRPQRGAWGPPNRHSNSDDTGSISSRSLPGSPAGSPTQQRKDKSHRRSLGYNDLEAKEMSRKEPPGPFRNVKLSQPALSHKFKKLRSSSKCKNCDSYVYFNGAECEHCGLTCHKKCLESLAIKCGRSRLPRKMTTFGVDFHKHLDATHRKNIPLIMEKCIAEVDRRCLQVKGIYRLSGVKTKVETLSQQFETAGEMVDLSTTNPNLISSVLKLYLRELPEPLMTFDLYPTFIQVAQESSNLKFDRKDTETTDERDDDNDSKCEECLKKLHGCVQKLPHANYYTVVRLFQHLRRHVQYSVDCNSISNTNDLISDLLGLNRSSIKCLIDPLGQVANNEEFNQMSVSNLAIVFGPTLLRPRGNISSLSALMDMTHQAKVVELIIDSRILEDDFNIQARLDELDTTKALSNSPSTKELRASSDIDLQGPSQKDKDNLSLEDLTKGKRELSLSDELQINFPAMFKPESDGRDLRLSLGSVDGISNSQSPDIEDELKDLVHRGHHSNRCLSSNLMLEKSDPEKPPSPMATSVKSESNVSFSSLSPVDLPDTSWADDTSPSPDVSLSVKLEEEPVIQPTHESPSPTKVILEGLELEKVVVVNETEQHATSLSPRYAEVNNSPSGNDETNDATPRRSRRSGNVAIVAKDSQHKSANETVHSLDKVEKKSKAVTLATLAKSVLPSSNMEPPSSQQESCQETTSEQVSQKSIESKYEYSSEENVSTSKRGTLSKTGPRVAPKPPSPAVSTSKQEDLVAKSASCVQVDARTEDEEISRNIDCSSSCDSATEDSSRSLVHISGNTRKLRDKFTAALDGSGNSTKTADIEGDDDLIKTQQMKRESSSSRQSSFETEGDDKQEATVMGQRGTQNTAKLVEKFIRKSEMKQPGRKSSPVDGGPLSPRGVSVKKILKQFESGDEMGDDEDDDEVVKKSSSKSNMAASKKISTSDVNAHREIVASVSTTAVPTTFKVGSSPVHSGRKNIALKSQTNENHDDRPQASCDSPVKREPKFV